MKRLHLFELEDQPWVPASVRDGATDILDLFFARIGMYRPLAPMLATFMHATQQQRWFDMCSGGGGGALAMRAELLALGEAPAELTLTDRYPNVVAQRRVAALNDPGVRYHADAVDALNVKPHPPAIRTMFGALHHFQPDGVRSLLQAAVDARAPLAWVDVAAAPVLRRMPVVLAPLAAVPNLLLLFVLALLLVPMARPFRWSRVLWTYLMPAIPLLFAWDGTVSAFRAYTPEELLALTRSVRGGERYGWEAERKGRVLILTGRPQS